MSSGFGSVLKCSKAGINLFKQIVNKNEKIILPITDYMNKVKPLSKQSYDEILKNNFFI